MASTISVVEIGSFAGGSFGTAGNPSKVYRMWAVRCPRNSGDLHAAGFVFASREEAERFAREEELREQGREIERRRAAERRGQIARRRADLERGWDGCRFVGVEEGRRIAASLPSA